jgi:Na+-driven multidrug efflux pump
MRSIGNLLGEKKARRAQITSRVAFVLSLAIASVLRSVQ